MQKAEIVNSDEFAIFFKTIQNLLDRIAIIDWQYCSIVVNVRFFLVYLDRHACT